MTKKNGSEEPDFISQDDIDQLLQMADAEEDNLPSESDQGAGDLEKAVDEEAFLSQADLDQLLQAADGAENSAQEDEKVSSESLGDVVDDEALVSQDDIERLLNGNLEAPPAGATLPDTDSGKASPEDTEKQDEALISQADIDQLLSEDSLPETSPSIQQPGPEPSAQPEAADDTTQTAPEGGPKNYISQEVIDSLLKEAAASGEKEEAAEEIHQVILSEEDDSERDNIASAELIDAHESDSDLINQDDIDKLLSSDHGLDDHFETTDNSPSNSPTPEAPAVASQREDAFDAQMSGQEAQDLESETPQEDPETPWYRSKWLWTGAIGSCLVFGAALILYFLPITSMWGPSSRQTTYYPIIYPEQNGVGSAARLRAGLISLSGFIVSAPEDHNDCAYLAVDVDIDVDDASAARRIKEHRPFFRKVIYDVISEAIESNEKCAAEKMNIKMAILGKLNAVLPVDAGTSEKVVRNVYLNNMKIQ